MEKEIMEKEGWILSSTSSGAHLKRWLKEYEEMGFDVYLEQTDLVKENKHQADCCWKCTACYSSETEPPYRIYVKSRKPTAE